jgi:hypothetical protein
MDTRFVLYFVVPVVGGTVILLAGLIFLFIDNRKKKKNGDVETGEWETTGGKIIASHLERHEARKDDKTGTHIDINYEPIIEYVYTVKNEEYRSNKVFPGDHIYFSEKDAQQILDEHPLNMYMPVKYNPEDPNISSLENRPHATDYVHVLALVFTSFGALVCCFTTFMTFIVMGKYK